MRALVTGAGKRLGRAMALHLARAGHDVAVHYATSEVEARQTAAEITALGRRAALVRADLLDEAQTQGLVPAASAALGGPLTVLVNNASIFEYDNLRSATRAGWDRHMESNLRAPFVLMQAFAAQCPPALRDEAGEALATGLIVNMIDQRVWKPTPEFMTYSLAKAALWALTRTAAQALAPQIRVNAIGPGPTLPSPRQSATQFRRQNRMMPLERGTTPEEVAATVRFILAAPAMTGQMIALDGGQHLAWTQPGEGPALQE